MRLFISYARVDKPYCVQIVDMLDAHDVWYDHRIHAGQDWWKEIQEQIALCEGFVYLLSPESATSEYCQKELEIAHKANKNIFPVLIHPEVELPNTLKHIHYADLTKGITAKGVKQLLNAIFITERRNSQFAAVIQQHQQATVKAGSGGGATTPKPPSATVKVDLPKRDATQLISEVAIALETGNYDKAVFALKQAKDNGVSTRFINIEAILREAEAALESQSYLREAQREYAPIASMVKQTKMRQVGCKAFQEYRKHFPDYDPENLAAICSTELMPDLEWCVIPAGEVTISLDSKEITYFIETFKIAKYPVTNAQFQAFVDDPEGYTDPRWWQYSPQAVIWHEQHEQPMNPRFSWGDHPRANVSWYEATAFCHWISAKTGIKAILPTEQQWQRAAQGSDGRTFPWGNRFDKSRCNSREGGLRTTTPVNRYEKKGASPFSVCDMAGNVWQWCSNMEYKSARRGTTKESHVPRAVRGGSFISVSNRVKANAHFYLNPLYRYPTIGFRLATMVKE